jgi:hypothetical protein
MLLYLDLLVWHRGIYPFMMSRICPAPQVTADLAASDMVADSFG